jgi:hypothetical protein
MCGHKKSRAGFQIRQFWSICSIEIIRYTRSDLGYFIRISAEEITSSQFVVKKGSMNPRRMHNEGVEQEEAGEIV